jgi:hypothetical protein
VNDEFSEVKELIKRYDKFSLMTFVIVFSKERGILGKFINKNMITQ